MIFRKLFINRNVTSLFLGQVISQAGDSMFQIGLIWLVLELTGSRALTGILASASYLPFLIFSLPAGTIADRFSKKWIMAVADIARILLVLTIPLLFITDHLSIPLLGVITFLTAIFQALFYPARDALIPEITREEDLPYVNALIQTSWQLAVLLGPAMAAILIPRVGIIHLFSADSATFLLSLLVILMLVPKKQERRAKSDSNAVKETLEGVRFVMKDPLLRIVVLITALDNLILMGPAIVGIPIFVKDTLHLGATHYAWVEAALAGGALVGAPIIALTGKRLHMGKLFLWGVILDGLTYLPLYFVRSYRLTIAVIFFHSIFIPMVTISRTTLVQTSAPPHMRGRIFSIILMCVIGGTAISSAVTGLLAEFIPMPTIYLGMALLAASTAIPGLFSKAIRERRCNYSAG